MNHALLEQGAHPIKPDLVSAAIERAKAHLLAEQLPDGSWDCLCDAGASTTAQSLVALSALGRLSPEIARGALRTIVAAQSWDGGFEAWPRAGRSDPGATAAVLAALSLPELREETESHTPRERASFWLARAGGASAAIGALARGDCGAIFAAWSGVIPASSLPMIPLDWVCSSSLLEALKRRVHIGLPLLLAQMGAIRAHLLKRRSTVFSGLEERAKQRLLAMLDELQNPNGSFINIATHTALAALTLLSTGVSARDERLQRLGDWLLQSASKRDNGEIWFPAFASSLWTTSLSVRALLRANEPTTNPAIHRAIEWLLEAQSTKPQATGNQPGADAIRVGGFGFQKHNERMVDCDDTAVAIDALASCAERPELDSATREKINHALMRAVLWLRSMQNPDGAWAAFVKGLPGKPPGPIMTQPPSMPFTLKGMLGAFSTPLYALGDPSTEDVTGRVLRALHRTGIDKAHPIAASALSFLQRMQCQDGAWWGRWSSNYIWTTAHVLLGVLSSGVRADEPWVLYGKSFLLRHQNEDGGFGETEESYRDLNRVGCGPSMPDVTALVIEALVALGEARSPETERAVRYLLQTQTPRGDWPDMGHLQVIIPPDSFYLYTASLKFQPLEALISWREALSSS
jgi:squalene cyclase